MVPHGGYTVPNSPTRYAHPAPSLDIRCRVTNAVPTAEHASDNLCGCARPYSRCLSNGNVPWYHTVDIPSLIHRPGTLTRPRHTIFVRRAAPFFALKMANLGRLRNLLCLHFWLFKQTSGREGPGRMLTWKCRGWLTAACLGEHCPRAHAQFRVVRALFCTIAHC